MIALIYSPLINLVILIIEQIPWDKIIHDVFHQVNITIGENEQILFTHKEYYKKLSEIIKETNEK